MLSRLITFTAFLLVSTQYSWVISGHDLIAGDVPYKENRAQKRTISIKFDNADILLFVKFISEVTRKNFILDNKVRGKVTVFSPTKISIEEAYRIFLSVLEVHSLTTIESGAVIKIVPSTVARGKNIQTRLLEEANALKDNVITQIVRLHYANPDEIKKIFAPLFSKSSVVVSYAASGMLIVTDVESNIARLLRIIRAIDVKGIGEEISVLPLQHATASVLVNPLTTVFQTAGQKIVGKSKKRTSALSHSIKIVADDRTNSIVLSASEHDSARIKQLIKILDQEMPKEAGGIFIYYLQHAEAEKIADVLSSLPKEAKGASDKHTPVLSKETKIIADKATNALVIKADRKDRLRLIDVIEKLDIPQSMVYIEALVMEVKADKDFRIGTEWRIGDDKIGSFEGKTIGTFAGTTPGDSIIPTNAILPSGLSVGVLGESITIGGVEFPSLAVMTRAFQSDSDIHILQRPQLLTSNNQEAEIQVADNLPYLVKEASGKQDYATYEYRDVGSSLKITPQINQKRFVRLKMSQEYSTLSEGSSAEKPSTLKRSVDTTVVAKDGHTVVIGGLAGDQISRGTSGVPCLVNIPVFGWLFKSYSRRQSKTNLYIFLTPHIVKNSAEARQIYEEKSAHIKRVEEGIY